MLKIYLGQFCSVNYEEGAEDLRLLSIGCGCLPREEGQIELLHTLLLEIRIALKYIGLV